jgi:hypothetical protein
MTRVLFYKENKMLGGLRMEKEFFCAPHSIPWDSIPFLCQCCF